jgi:putative cell wall-binding protein
VILGGSAAVSSQVEAALHAYAPTVERIAGSNRYETAAAISQTYLPFGATRAYVASGRDFPDALTGASLAGRFGAPLLLVDETDVVPFETLEEIRRLAPDLIIIIGGESVVTQAVASTLFGIQ